MSWAAIGVTVGSTVGGIIGRPKAPKAATPAKVDLNATVQESIAANSANFKGAADLAKRQNDFGVEEGRRSLDMAIPGFSKIQAALIGKVNEDLATTGLSADVTANIQRKAAERGVSRGTSGGFNDFSLVRDFGFNLVDFENAKRARALSTLSQVYGMAPRVNPMTPMSSFVTPGQALGNAAQNEQSRFASQQAQFNAEAAASNANRAIWGSVASTAIGAAATIAGRPSTKTPGGDGTAYGDMVAAMDNAATGRK